MARVAGGIRYHHGGSEPTPSWDPSLKIRDIEELNQSETGQQSELQAMVRGRWGALEGRTYGLVMIRKKEPLWSMEIPWFSPQSWESGS